MKQHKQIWGMLVMLLALLGCQPTPLPIPTETPQPTAITEARTPVPTWTPTVTAPPATPFPTPPAATTPQPTATTTPFPACAPVWQRSFLKTEPLSDLILFTSVVRAPFASTHAQQTVNPPHLWAFAADGRRSERLSFGDETLFLRPTSDDDAVTVELLVTHPLSLETDFVRQHALLPECATQITRSPCAQFHFSPNGTWAAYFWGAEACGRGIAALDLRTGVTRVLTETGGHTFTFLTDETMLMSSGHCEGGDFALVDLRTGEQTVLGEAGAIQWNAPRTAFTVNVHPYLRWGSYVWGYDHSRGRHFLSSARTYDVEESQPVWTPSGDHLLYQQRVISYTTPAKLALTLDPQQIVSVDAATGERRILLDDPDYDYHLCMAYEICPWEGDFIEVRRIPYRQHAFDLYPDFGGATVNCAIYGFRCADPVERFALNWRTGELVPWDARPAAAEPPTATPTPAPAALASQPSTPDLARPAFYTAPDGSYTLRLGQDEQSLWCLPAGGEPVLWVNNGAHFTYVP